MAIEKDILGISWDKIDPYEFEGKATLKRMIVNGETIENLASTESFSFPNGTPVSKQTVRKYIYRALAHLALKIIATIEKDAEELLPCPFCGNNAYISQDKSTDYEHYWTWYVNCTDCMASIDCMATKQQAINAWNSRTKNFLNPADATQHCSGGSG